MRWGVEGLDPEGTGIGGVGELMGSARRKPASGLKLFLKWPQLFPFPASPSWFYVHSVLPEPYFQSAFFFFFPNQLFLEVLPCSSLPHPTPLPGIEDGNQQDFRTKKIQRSTPGPWPRTLRPPRKDLRGSGARAGKSRVWFFGVMEAGSKRKLGNFNETPRRVSASRDPEMANQKEQWIRWLVIQGLPRSTDRQVCDSTWVLKIPGWEHS